MMKRTLLALALLGAAATASPAFQKLAVGDLVTDFSLVGFQGEIVHLNDVKGKKATVIAFWATWSPRSVEALADLQKFCEKNGNGDLRVIGVNEEHENWEPGEFERVSDYVKNLGLAYSIVADMDLSLYGKYGVTVLPSLILIDGERKTVSTLAGYPQHSREEFYNELRRALGLPPEG